MRMIERVQAYEYGLPKYLQHNPDAYKDGVKNHSGLLDCLWGNCTGTSTLRKLTIDYAGTCGLSPEEIPV